MIPACGSTPDLLWFLADAEWVLSYYGCGCGFGFSNGYGYGDGDGYGHGFGTGYGGGRYDY